MFFTLGPSVRLSFAVIAKFLVICGMQLSWYRMCVTNRYRR
jgi:hypothetical protein